MIMADEIAIFWDSISCMSHPTYFYYENHLHKFIYDGFLDNGDPRIIQFYLAIVWTLFGKSLFISHLFFLPATIGSIFQLYKLSTNTDLRENQYRFQIISFSFILALVDPAFITQIILLGTDVWVIFFALYAINMMIKGKRWQISVAFILLCISNRRGMIIAASLMISYLIIYITDKKENREIRSIINHIIPTLPACIVVIIYILIRFTHQGWVFSNPSSSWSETSEFANFGIFIHNCINFIWRNLDSGRVFIWAFIIYTIFKFGIKNVFTKENRYLWISYIILQSVFICVTLPLCNPFGARYFIVQFILIDIFTIHLLFKFYSIKRSKILGIILIILLASGNIWSYSEKIAQNWDCTLSHLSFYRTRKNCLDYLEKEGIELREVASGFSIYGKQKYIFINDDEREISSCIKDSTKYYIYSNICNEKDEFIDELNHKNSVIKEFKKGNIFIKVIKINNVPRGTNKN